MKYRVKVDVSYVHFSKDFDDPLAAVGFMADVGAVECKDEVRPIMFIVDDPEADDE